MDSDSVNSSLELVNLDQNILDLRHNLTDMMSRFNNLSAYILLILTLYAIPGKNQELEQCKGVDIDLTEEHTMHMNECLEKAGAKEVKDLPPNDMPCFGKCVFHKKGLLDDKGMPHKEKILGLITDHLPKEVHDDLNKRISACLHPNETAIIDPTDESCATYLPMMMCVHVSFLEECQDDD